ncbi:MAG: hypothetical protein Kow0010_18090 [Dehalococcoidia bacterium]
MRRVFPLLFAVIAAALLAAATACTPRDNAAVSTPAGASPTLTVTTPAPANATPTPGAPANATATPQPLPPALQQMLEDVAGLRQLPSPPALDAYVIHRSELTATLEDLITDEDMAWFHNTTTLYRLLGHFRDDQDYYSIYQSFGTQAILGFYAPDRDALWVVTDGDPSRGFDGLTTAELETLAHELLHAIQDYNFDLDGVYRAIADNLDRDLAWTAIVEGDAVVHESLYSQRYLARSFGGRLFLLAHVPAAQDVPPSIIRELYMPYTTGADAVQRFVSSAGLEAVDRLLADPPGGTTLILHPTLLGTGWHTENVTLPDIASALGQGWSRESGGSLGEFHLQNYLRLELSSNQAISAADGWAGDRYDVYVHDGDSVALFRLRFAGDDEADEFLQAHAGFLDRRSTGQRSDGDFSIVTLTTGKTTVVAPRQGRDVLFVIGSTEAVARAAMTAIAEQ